ncbi:MAG TPA: ankyrin repeat domain-containing protein [Steroidobacteraceae bacterium]
MRALVAIGMLLAGGPVLAADAPLGGIAPGGVVGAPDGGVAQTAPVGPQTLIQAARGNDHGAALKALELHVDVNARMSDGTTALHWAVHTGDADLVARLLKAGAKVKAVNEYGSTPMSEAAERADAKILELLLKAGADVESPNPHGQTALMTVVRTDHIDAAELLISRRANVNAREGWRGQTALMWASAQGQPEMVKLLIAHGADPNARSFIRDWDRKVTAEPRPQNRPYGGLTALLLAAREGCAGCAEALVKGKADINLGDPDNISPLLMAIFNGRFDAAAYLIKAGANPNKWDTWGRAPLYSAVDYNTTPRGGRPDRPSSDRTTSLEVEDLLLAAEANPNMQLKLFPPYRSLGQDRGADGMLTVGTTPLLRAAKAGDADSIKLLLAHGALVDLPNNQGITPLLATAGIGSTTIDTRARFRDEQKCIGAAKLLLAAGADINAQRDNGQTAVHGAALWGWSAFVQFLADNHANLQIADRDGMKALDIANGKVGGTGRQGLSAPEPHKETAALLEKLIARN